MSSQPESQLAILPSTTECPASITQQVFPSASRTVPAMHGSESKLRSTFNRDASMDKPSALAQSPISPKHYPGDLEDSSGRANVVSGCATNHTCPCKANDSSTEDELVAGQPPSIWATYVNAAERYEGRVVDRWNADMDALLVFAGLFTVVITAFIVYVIGDLSENYAQTTANMLRILAAQSVNGTTGQLVASPPFDGPDSTARFVNIVWFLAVILSVAASTGAMLCKLWCTKFRSLYAPEKYAEAYLDMTCKMQKQFDAMEGWKMKTVVEVLPGILHVAVGLFFLGLWKYLQAKDAIIGYVIGGVAILVTLAYVMLTVISLIWDAPYSTPFTPLLSLLLRLGVEFIHTLWMKQISNALLRWVIWLLRIMFLTLLSPLLLIPTLCMVVFMATIACMLYFDLRRAQFYLYEVLMFVTIVISTLKAEMKDKDQTDLQVNALVRLLYIPLKYDNVCGALKTLLQLATSRSSGFLDDSHVLECAKTCLRFVMPLVREDGIVMRKDEMSSERRDLFFYCTRILSFNRISQAELNSKNLLANLPNHAFFDELLESKSYTGATDKEVQLLCDSLWLRPSEKRGEVAFRWANDHLRGATRFPSDTVFIELIRNAEQWLRKSQRGKDLPSPADVQSLELAPVPSTKVIYAALPYFNMLVSPRFVGGSTMPPSQLVKNLIDVLSMPQKLSTPQNPSPKWICSVICAIWSNDPEVLQVDRSIAEALLNWVSRSLKDGSLDNLLALLNAITHGPKVLPAETVRPLSTLSDIYKEVAKYEHIPTDSQGRDVLHHIVQAYAATFEYAFENSNDQNFGHVQDDFGNSFEIIAEYLKQNTGKSVACTVTPINMLSSTFFSIVSHPDQDHLPLSPTIVESFKFMMRNQGQPSQASLQLRWICSIVRAALRKYPTELDESVAQEFVTFVYSSQDDTPEAIQMGIEMIIRLPNSLPTKDLSLPTTISVIYDRMVKANPHAGTRTGLQPQFRDLYRKVLRAYISIVEDILVKNNPRDCRVAGYEQGVRRSITTISNTITWVCGPNQDRNLTLLTIYPLALLFWSIKLSTEEVENLLKPHRDSLIDLFIETSGLFESRDQDAIECNLDIKFYCAKLLSHLFAETIKPSDREKLRTVLPKLETLALEGDSPRVRWKAIYVIIQMEPFYEMWWYRDMRRTCRKIAKDLSRRIVSGETSMDTKWDLLAGSEKRYLIGYLNTIIAPATSDSDSKQYAYYWTENDLPFLKPGPRSQQVVPNGLQTVIVDQPCQHSYSGVQKTG